MRVEQHLEGPVVLGAQLAIFVDEGLGGERMVAEPSVRASRSG